MDTNLLRTATSAMHKLMEHSGIADTEAADELTPGLRMLATVRCRVRVRVSTCRARLVY